VPDERSLIKELDHVDDNYRRLIEASPFVLLATSGPAGLDCSPRGDAPGLVRVVDAKTLMLPDRRGNNRLDTLRNLVADPRLGMLFMIPGVGETLRVNGRAIVSTDPRLLQSFTVQDKPPRTVLVITVDSVYFQCSRAVVRAGLWKPDGQVDRRSLPSAGDILAACSDRRIDGGSYDAQLPERVAATLY
jgi:PPOX class probable FMN-dependent enzyme